MKFDQYRPKFACNAHFKAFQPSFCYLNFGCHLNSRSPLRLKAPRGKAINPYSYTADKLIKSSVNNRKSDSLVKIDHLAFSFRLADLRHCRKAGFADSDNIRFPKMPKFNSFRGTGSHDEALKALEHYKENQSKMLSEYYLKTLRIFAQDVLGFSISGLRGRGFQGYNDSMTMRSCTGSEVGFVGIGGQRDTVYFQISGTGCKYLFEHTTPFKIHHWLNTVIGIDKLSRIDLARDCYDGNFDCDYASDTYRMTRGDAFRTGKGGRAPTHKPANESYFDSDGKEVFDVEMFIVGKRTSPVYWRVYNKKLEQGIEDENLIWYRTECELKKWNSDVLLDIDAAFGGICEFSSSMAGRDGIRTRLMTKQKEVCLDLASRVKWIRHACGKALGDILEITNGDIQRTIGLILPDDTGGKLGIPPTYNDLINHALEA